MWSFKNRFVRIAANEPTQYWVTAENSPSGLVTFSPTMATVLWNMRTGRRTQKWNKNQTRQICFSSARSIRVNIKDTHKKWWGCIYDVHPQQKVTNAFSFVYLWFLATLTVAGQRGKIYEAVFPTLFRFPEMTNARNALRKTRTFKNARTFALRAHKNIKRDLCDDRGKLAKILFSGSLNRYIVGMIQK